MTSSREHLYISLGHSFEIFSCEGLIPGSEIALSWSPMRLKIEYWRPEFHNWSPVGELLLSSEPFANKCLTFYPADVFEIKMNGVFPLTTSITSQAAMFFFRFLIKYVLRAKKLRLRKEI